jgi:hypothetical protein
VGKSMGQDAATVKYLQDYSMLLSGGSLPNNPAGSGSNSEARSRPLTYCGLNLDIARSISAPS